MEKRKLAFILGIIGGILAVLLAVLTPSGVTTGELGKAPSPFSSPSVFMPILCATLGLAGAAMSNHVLKVGSSFMLLSAIGGPITLGWSYLPASLLLAASGLMGLMGNIPANSAASPAAPAKIPAKIPAKSPVENPEKSKSMKTPLIVGGVIILILFILIFFIFQKVGPNGVTNIITPKTHSIYEGTYTGTFNYKCQHNTFDGQGNMVEGDWVPKSFDFTITLAGDEWPDTYTQESLGVVSVQISDPVFGATSPVSLVGQANEEANVAVFKRVPAGSTGEILSGGDGFLLNLPGGKFELPADLGTNGECHFMIAADGSEMHSISCDTEDLWLASTRSGCFTADNYGFTSTTDVYDVEYGDWKLTKVA